ncbi:DNA-processing protein DprA [soil metagenome]
MERDELAGWLRLTLTPGIGDISARKLLAAFGLPPHVFAQSEAALQQVVSPAQAAALRLAPSGWSALVGETWDWLQAVEPSGATRRLLTLADPAYPASLLDMIDPPLMLYVIGAPQFDLTGLDRVLAIVCSRNPTPQGTLNARDFCRALGEADITVVSGLALGVDGAAHEGALDAAKGTDRFATIAVVGTGLDRVYPARHRDLAHRITAQGLIVSEFALGTPPLNQNFPKRNRIIAGLTRGTLVVEAALRSGSLITARLAVEQGKEVFAIPGSIHSPQSRGGHSLIRQGAKLVESVQDILEELRFVGGAATSESSTVSDANSGSDLEGDDVEASSGLLHDLGFDPVSLDALCARTGYSAAELQGRLLELELDGHVARLPGGLFQRVAVG